jgi:CheY-like chemotaxis protein
MTSTCSSSNPDLPAESAAVEPEIRLAGSAWSHHAFGQLGVWLVLAAPYSDLGPDHDGSASPRIAAILVVDDNEDIRECLKEVLEDAGFTVHLAEHGKAALAALERIGRPSLILVDILMPVMNGPELIDALKQDPRFLALPIVAFSAASTVTLPPEIPLLQKPIGLTALLSTVEKHRLR